LANHKFRPSQNIDIWSLGCVYTKNLAWVKNQHKETTSYQRREGTSPKFRNVDCFHSSRLAKFQVQISGHLRTAAPDIARRIRKPYQTVSDFLRSTQPEVSKLDKVIDMLPSLLNDIGSKVIESLVQSQVQAAAIFAHISTWFAVLMGTILSFLAMKKSRAKAHTRQAMFLSMLFFSTPAAATSLETSTHSSCSSFLSALHHEFTKQLILFMTPQPPYPRSFPSSTLLLTTLWATTITVLLYTLLSSKPHIKKFLFGGLLVSALGGAMLAVDIPDLVFRYLFVGIIGALMVGALIGRFWGETKNEWMNGVKKEGYCEVVDVDVEQWKEKANRVTVI